MNLIEKLRMARLLSKAAGRLKEAKMQGTLKTAVVGIAAAIFSAVVTSVTARCPDLLQEWPTILSGAVTAGVALWLRKPSDKPVIQAAAAKGITHESIK